MTGIHAAARQTDELPKAQIELPDDPRGQVLVIVAAAMVALIAMVGLVIDGGYAWGRQRETQNAADAVAKAGTVVVQYAYHDPANAPTDGDVGCAVQDAADAHGVELVKAVYTNHEGTPLSPEVVVGECGVSTAPIPVNSEAQGIKATTEQVVDTFLARVVGISQLTPMADATAVVAPQVGICPAGAGCGILPVTFPTSAVYCDGTNSQVSFDEPEWEIIDPEDAVASNDAATNNMVIIPLCSTTAGTESPGSVGWLDYGCGNLSETVENPCNEFIPIPAWVQTQTGNVNSVEDELNEYSGDQINVAEFDDADTDRDEIMPLPVHTNTCESDPDGPENDPDLYTPVCPEGNWSGQGNTTFYHAEYWIGFMLDQAYVQGSNAAECNSLPGEPSGTAGSGATSCLKGWFVAKYEAPGTMGIGDLTPGGLESIGILLLE